MYSIRAVPLLAPAAAGFWVSDGLGAGLLALVVLGLLAASARSVHIRLSAREPQGRHRAGGDAERGSTSTSSRRFTYEAETSQ